MAMINYFRKSSRPLLGPFLSCTIFLSLTWGLPVSAEQFSRAVEGEVIGPLETFRDCDVCPEMIVLPLGSFKMGAPLEESAFIYSLWTKPEPGVEPGYPHEGPVHEVEIDIPIAIGRDEITREEWMVCVAEGGCSHTPDPRILKFGGGHYYADDPRHPVMDISYIDMLEYIDWLNDRIGEDVYRLPTEAEWEYAARAGTQTRFAQGETLSREQANIAVFHLQGDRYIPDPDNHKMPVTVDELDAANPWGIRHIAGNVVEQTMSCDSQRHLGLPTSSAYLADAEQPSACRRTTKGGRFGSGADYARPANRGSSDLTYRSKRRGFRILREM